MADKGSVDFSTCHDNRKDCAGPEWKDKGFWSGKVLIVIFLVVASALAFLTERVVATSTSLDSHLEQNRRTEERQAKQFEHIDKKLDRILMLNGHSSRETKGGDKNERN